MFPCCTSDQWMKEFIKMFAHYTHFQQHFCCFLVRFVLCGVNPNQIKTANESKSRLLLWFRLRKRTDMIGVCESIFKQEAAKYGEYFNSLFRTYNNCIFYWKWCIASSLPSVFFVQWCSVISIHLLSPNPFVKCIFYLEESNPVSILFERTCPGDLHISVGLQSNYLLGFQRLIFVSDELCFFRTGKQSQPPVCMRAHQNVRSCSSPFIPNKW